MSKKNTYCGCREHHADRVNLPYFVYYGVKSNLDTKLVLKRVLVVSTSTNEMITHLIEFVHACFSSHNLGYSKPCLLSSELSNAPTVQAKNGLEEILNKTNPKQHWGSVKPGCYTYMVAIYWLLKPWHEMSQSELSNIIQICENQSAGNILNLLVWLQECTSKRNK